MIVSTEHDTNNQDTEIVNLFYLIKSFLLKYQIFIVAEWLMIEV